MYEESKYATRNDTITMKKWLKISQRRAKL